MVDTPAGEIRRNHSHLNIVPNETTGSQDGEEIPENNTAENTAVPRRRIMTRSQTGTTIRPPNYL